MNTNELFARLNTLRVANGVNPLKAWKGSRAQLETQVAKYEAEQPPVDAPVVNGHDHAEHVTLVQIADRLGIDQKVARAKLRRVIKSNPGAFTRGDKGWSFPPAFVVTVEETLKTDNRRRV